MVGFWIATIILLTIIEAATVNLTTVWFIASALLALIASFITDNLFIQFGIFSVVGVLLLIFTKPALTRILKGKGEKTNLDRIIGMKGVVVKEISPMKPGEVKVDGKIWTSIADSKLAVGDIVNILKIESVKLKVEKWEE